MCVTGVDLITDGMPDVLQQLLATSIVVEYIAPSLAVSYVALAVFAALALLVAPAPAARNDQVLWVMSVLPNCIEIVHGTRCIDIQLSMQHVSCHGREAGGVAYTLDNRTWLVQASRKGDFVLIQTGFAARSFFPARAVFLVRRVWISSEVPLRPSRKTDRS